MKRFIMFLSLIAGVCASSFAQGAKNIQINEVLTSNTESLVDDYGHHHPWVELANNSFTTYNVRGMYITTDRAALNKNLTVPERIKLMSQITNGSKMTVLEGQQHVVFYLNAKPSHGDCYLDSQLFPDTVQWVGLFDGNAIDLIDSISIPALNENESWARQTDGSDEWVVKAPENVSPGIANVHNAKESKIAKLKREDPYGIGITVLSMGVVFFCLALLYVAFMLLGKFMTRSKHLKEVIDMDKPQNRKLDMVRQADDEEENAEAEGAKNGTLSVDHVAKRENLTPEIAAAIAMAIKDYQDDVHVEESGVITLIPHQTRWH